MSISVNVVSTTISKILSRKGKVVKTEPKEEVPETYVRGEIPEKLYPAEAFRVDAYFKPWMGLR